MGMFCDQANLSPHISTRVTLTHLSQGVVTRMYSNQKLFVTARIGNNTNKLSKVAFKMS